jgi:AcrR family transcriptional regulator
MEKLNEKKKEDLRIRRTYKLLSEALLSLLLEKSFEEIFVTDICERAMVHRTTFYKHFEDKYHLLDFCVKELISNFEGDEQELNSISSMKDYYMGLIRKSLEYMAGPQRTAPDGDTQSRQQFGLSHAPSFCQPSHRVKAARQ